MCFSCTRQSFWVSNYSFDLNQRSIRRTADDVSEAMTIIDILRRHEAYYCDDNINRGNGQDWNLLRIYYLKCNFTARPGSIHISKLWFSLCVVWHGGQKQRLKNTSYENTFTVSYFVATKKKKTPSWSLYCPKYHNHPAYVGWKKV